jgi:hypothetical protein
MEDVIKKSVGSIVRLALGFAAGFLSARGIIDAETGVALAGDANVQIIAGAVITLATGIWTAYKNKKEVVKLEKAIAAPAGKAE